MEINVSKKDMLWSYVAQFFNVGAGFITLPLILHMLTTEEIAMNYLMLTVGSLVSLIDFGFAPQFGRNVTYVFSGAQHLEKEGLSADVDGMINYHLLKALILVAKRVYLYMSLIVLVLMLSLGTWYIWNVTNGFTNVDNSFYIWCVYSISTFFNIYFFYYSSLLTGRGQIKESKKAIMAQKIVYIVLCYVLLLSGCGLISVCIANLVAPFFERWLCYRYFYDEKIKRKLEKECVTNKEMKSVFEIIWYNAKKLGINFIGAYAILKASMFIAGLYLSSALIASYGLMTQLTNILVGVSTTFFISYMPKITSHRVSQEKTELIKSFAWAMNVYYLIFVIGAIVLTGIGPLLLDMIGSKAVLPSSSILAFFLFVTLLENNHSLYCTLITTGNKIPFVKTGLISGAVICVLDIIVLQFTTLDLLGIILVQGLVQLACNNWYWPRWVCRDLNISFCKLVNIGFQQSFEKITNALFRK